MRRSPAGAGAHHARCDAAVGLFNRANVVCGLPDKILLSAIFSVAFPAFAAESQSAERSVKDAYLKIISYITALYWPAVLVVAILAHPIVHVALGQAWDAASSACANPVVAAIFWFPNILTFPVLVALGANREAFRANFIGRGMSIIVICTASFFGLYALVLKSIHCPAVPNAGFAHLCSPACAVPLAGVVRHTRQKCGGDRAGDCWGRSVFLPRMASRSISPFYRHLLPAYFRQSGGWRLWS